MPIPSLSKFVSLLVGWLDIEDLAPGAPAAGRVRLIRRLVAGRQMPGFINPAGQRTTLQPSFARNRIGLYSASGSSTVISNVGFGTATVVGTVTGRTPSTSLIGRLRRVGYVSAATAAAFASIRFPNFNYFSLGDGAGLGGYHYVQRFMITDAAAVAGARMFAGLAPIGAATNVEPSTLTTVIGMGHGAADTTMQVYISGTTAQTPINLGASFPITANTPYEFSVFSSPLEVDKLTWEALNMATGVAVTGNLTAVAATGPINSVMLCCGHMWRTNNATLLAVSLDLLSIYIETDD